MRSLRATGSALFALGALALLGTMARSTSSGGLGIDGWMTDFGEWVPPDAR